MKNILVLAVLLMASPLHAADGVKYKSVEADEASSSSDHFHGKMASDKNDLALGLGLDFFDSFGIQTRYAYRFLDEGFIENVSDAIYFEGGMGLTFYGNSVSGFNLLATARWDFQYDPKWILFADLGFGFNAISGAGKHDVRGGDFFPAIGSGVIYNFNQQNGARFDLSYQFLGLSYVKRF